MASISGIEALKLLGKFINAVYEKLVEDNSLSFADWISIATEIGKEVYDEYSDEDDI